MIQAFENPMLVKATEIIEKQKFDSQVIHHPSKRFIINNASRKKKLQPKQ